jgi:hypothetical protein
MLGNRSEGLILYNKQLASSDDDVFDLRVEPEVWNNRVLIADYPFIKKNYPGLRYKISKEDYLFTILLFWKYKKGEIRVHDNALYDNYIKTFKIRINILKNEPLLLYWIMVLKLNVLPFHNGALNLLKKLKKK